MVQGAPKVVHAMELFGEMVPQYKKNTLIVD